MARKRMIDPSIWTDEGMAELTPRQQLLYIGLFSNADDDGRLKGSPVAISLMLPTLYSPSDRGLLVEDLESVLASMNQLVRYVVDDREYLSFKNFRQWQRIDRPTDSILPAPSSETPAKRPKTPKTRSESETPREHLDEPSTGSLRVIDPSTKEEKLSEKKGVKDNSARGERAQSPIVPDEVIPGERRDAPFDLLASLCETLGQDVSVLSEREKGKQLVAGKRLVEAGMTAFDVSRMTQWLRTQSWVTAGIDLYLLEKQLGKWQLAGKPSRAAPPRKSNGGFSPEIMAERAEREA